MVWPLIGIAGIGMEQKIQSLLDSVFVYYDIT